LKFGLAAANCAPYLVDFEPIYITNCLTCFADGVTDCLVEAIRGDANYLDDLVGFVGHRSLLSRKAVQNRYRLTREEFG
jgi:hypothetical protein